MTTHRLEALRGKVAGERAYPLVGLAQPGFCKEDQEHGHSTKTLLFVTIKQGVIDHRIFLSNREKKISFNRYFYQPEPMLTLEEIRADILVVEREFLGGVKANG